MRKLPVLTREKAKTIFGVFKNLRHAPEFIPRVLDILKNSERIFGKF
ncbi:MAG: hypothetical protein WC584_00785 [Candidatus Pacearchaeota archaeon]